VVEDAEFLPIFVFAVEAQRHVPAHPAGTLESYYARIYAQPSAHLSGQSVRADSESRQSGHSQGRQSGQTVRADSGGRQPEEDIQASIYAQPAAHLVIEREDQGCVIKITKPGIYFIIYLFLRKITCEKK
jgi:hypothetical protein